MKTRLSFVLVALLAVALSVPASAEFAGEGIWPAPGGGAGWSNLADCSGVTGKGVACYNTATDVLCLGNGTSCAAVGGGTVFEVHGITIDGGGSAITTGVKGYWRAPYACTIVSATILADQSGSIVIDLWKDTFANYPPTDADSITAAAPPTLSSATNSTDTTLTGWTKTISEGDVIAFNVDSAATVTRVTLLLKVQR